jgi:putative tricarboxylic transport membrane protein
VSDATPSGPRPKAAAGIGIVLLLLAALTFFDAQRLPPGSAMGVGPAAAMRLVALLIAVLGIAHLWTAFRHRREVPVDSTSPEPVNHRALAWVLGSLAGLMLILQFGGGFIAASSWLFVLSARGFGARIGPKSIGIGVTLSLAVYLFFSKALSLGLPMGPLERLLS